MLFHIVATLGTTTSITFEHYLKLRTSRAGSRAGSSFQAEPSSSQ